MTDRPTVDLFVCLDGSLLSHYHFVPLHSEYDPVLLCPPKESKTFGYYLHTEILRIKSLFVLYIGTPSVEEQF